ncbi:MAG: glycerate 2-kinase [Chloroflexota bacterium]|jgi:glycerate kinase|nr:glycerate 2-kinase [Chloroflexota bacterium]
MRVVVAPNAYKGTLSPLEAARAIAAGLVSAAPGVECDLVPLSDGGDGFVEAMTEALGAARRQVLVRGPMHRPVAAAYALKRAGQEVLGVVEIAQAAGLVLVGDEERDPLGASTGGVGELLGEVRQAGATRMVVGLGGSATTDGGAGMARALGYRFLDDRGAELPEGGGSLRRLARIDPGGFDQSWLLLEVVAATDVDNPLLGPSGAAAVYGPQKGASPTDVAMLDEGLGRLADAVRRDLGQEIAAIPGAGAAGGLGAGLVAFLGARLEPGAASMLEAVDLRTRLRGSDMLVTGEGRLDGQSLRGKAPVVAGRLARGLGVRAVCLAGVLGEGWEAAVGDAFDAVVEVGPPGDDAAATLGAAAGTLV